MDFTPTPADRERAEESLRNIARKVTELNSEAICTTCEEGGIAFGGPKTGQTLVLDINITREGEDPYLFADLNDTLSWYEYDYETTEEFENDIALEVDHCIREGGIPDATPPKWALPAALLVAGGIFGVIMTVGFFLLSVLIALITGNMGTIPALIADGPWWKVLLCTWFLFSGALGILSLIRRK